MVAVAAERAAAESTDPQAEAAAAAVMSETWTERRNRLTRGGDAAREVMAVEEDAEQEGAEQEGTEGAAAAAVWLAATAGVEPEASAEGVVAAAAKELAERRRSSKGPQWKQRVPLSGSR